MAEVLAESGKTQLRIAETEKYAHVTFFFNGGKEKPYPGEERILVPSPRDVKTYDEKPEMSAKEVSDRASRALREKAPDFVLINYANPDMVGHTGNYEAAVSAMETLDGCLEQVVEAARQSGYHILITADHGNCEEMYDEKNQKILTQHSLNPVPLVWVTPEGVEPAGKLNDGGLADVMPTLCALMEVPFPSGLSGRNLIQLKA